MLLLHRRFADHRVLLHGQPAQAQPSTSACPWHCFSAEGSLQN